MLVTHRPFSSRRCTLPSSTTATISPQWILLHCIILSLVQSQLASHLLSSLCNGFNLPCRTMRSITCRQITRRDFFVADGRRAFSSWTGGPAVCSWNSSNFHGRHKICTILSREHVIRSLTPFPKFYLTSLPILVRFSAFIWSSPTIRPSHSSFSCISSHNLFRNCEHCLSDMALTQLGYFSKKKHSQ